MVIGAGSLLNDPHKDGKKHTNADALSRRPQDPGLGMGNDDSPEVTTLVNAVGSDRETGTPQADSQLTQPSTRNVPTSDLIIGSR